MKPLTFLSPVFLSLVILPAALASRDSDRVIIAAMKLSEQPNYSWSVSVADDAREYAIEGKTEAGGMTWMRLPMVEAVAKRLGRGAEPDVEAVFRDDGEFVIRTENGWRRMDELPRKHRDWRDDEGWGGGMTVIQPDPFDPTTVMVIHPSFDDKPPYSNAQFGMSRPHEELAIIISSYTQLQVDGDIAVGVLSDLGAQLLLVRDGQDHIRPVRAAGTFRLVMRDGIVTRYQLQLEGVLFIGRFERVYVRQQSSTEVRAIGATQVDVPYEVHRKLAAH
jgi:hypothetical protein